MWRSTFEIDAAQLRFVEEIAPKSPRCGFVPAQKPSDIVCAHEISIVNNYLMVSARATVDLSTKVVT